MGVDAQLVEVETELAQGLPPDPELDGARLRRLRRADPIGVDLQPDDAKIGTHRAQPLREFQGGHRQPPVAQIDHQRVSRRLQR